MRIAILGFLFSFALAFYAKAQIDETLISGSGAPTEAGIHSGRYKSNDKSPIRSSPVSDDKDSARRKSAPLRRPSMEEVFAPVPVKGPDTVKAEEASDDTTEQIHPDDVRLNIIEINFSSGVFYNHSKSDYSYRDYVSSAPFLSVGGTFWTNPEFAVFGQQAVTQGADILDSGINQIRSAVKHENFDLGFRARKFFGLSRKANSIEYGLVYSDYKLTVPADDTYRFKIRSTGLGIFISNRIPVSPGYAWVLAGKVYPRLTHAESATAISVNSGTSSESTRIGLQVGGEFKLSRQNQITWSLESTMEKNQFSGAASNADPSTGVIPTGVNVQNSFTIFSFGYRWGH